MRQRQVTASWTTAMQEDYDLYLQKQIELRRQEDAYKALSGEEQKAEEEAFRAGNKATTFSLEDFKKSDIYEKMSEADRKEILDSAAKTGSTTVTVLYFNNDQDAQAFAKKHGVKLIKIESPAEDPAVNPDQHSPRRPGH